MVFPFGETITRLRVGTVFDPYSQGTVEASWEDVTTPPTEMPILGVGVEPRSPSALGGAVNGEVDTETRTMFTSGFTLYLPPDSPEVLPTDRMRVRGRTYEVLGEAAEWRSPFTGWRPGSLVQVQRVVG